MNVESTNNVSTVSSTTKTTVSNKGGSDGQSSFADELKSSDNKQTAKDSRDDNTNGDIDSALDGLKDAVQEINDINQTDDCEKLKQNEVSGLIDNNMNVGEANEKLLMQMGASMNFDSNGQPFANFINNQQTAQDKLSSSAKELAEEQAILSTMEENMAIANRNMAMSKNKTVTNEHGIHKVDRNTDVLTDTVISYDSVFMTKADVDFFANLVDNGFLNMNEVTGAEKSSRVSKTLADLLLKSMNDNRPVRIDFDNDISVIIKIDRAGKISADFLPSSQVAEAYLKENLPLLRQRFDDNNIDYNELNQRQRKQEQEQENKKKERNNE